MEVFYVDLVAFGYSENVLIMSFFEFGCIIYENGLAGIDYGIGVFMLFFGDGLGSEFLGEVFDLDNID